MGARACVKVRRRRKGELEKIAVRSQAVERREWGNGEAFSYSVQWCS